MSTQLTVYIIQALWIVWLAVWIALSRRNKRTRRIEPFVSRLGYRLVLTAGLLLMLVGLPPVPQADEDMFARTTLFDAVCVGLTILGLGWATWARLHLGSNWSATVQVKEGHALVRSGPYAVTRHPIYTGLLCAFLGLAAFLDRWLEIPGFTLVVVGFWRKLKREERFMDSEFGGQYAQYRRQVGMLVPRPGKHPNKRNH